MRPLFRSEKRCISNLMQKKWGIVLKSAPTAVKDYTEPFEAKTLQNFNADFTLDFVDDFTMVSERDGTMTSILPNTLGADLYLFVDVSTFAPLHFELMFGGAFSIKYYARYVTSVEVALREAAELKENRQLEVQWHRVLDVVPLKRTAFLRLMVVGSDITFLCFPKETKPVMRGRRINLVKDDDREIDCYFNGDELVCVDGWVRTEIVRTDLTLVAIQEP